MLNPSASHTTMGPSTMLTYLKSPNFFNQNANSPGRLPVVNGFQMSSLNLSTGPSMKLQKPISSSPLPLLVSSTPKKTNFTSDTVDSKIISPNSSSEKSTSTEKPKLKFGVLNILADKEPRPDKFESSPEHSDKRIIRSSSSGYPVVPGPIVSSTRLNESISSSMAHQQESSQLTPTINAIAPATVIRHPGPGTGQMILGNTSSQQQLLDLMRSHLLSQGSINQEAGTMPNIQDFFQLYSSSSLPIQSGYTPLMSGVNPHAFLSGPPGIAPHPLMRFPLTHGEFPGGLFSYGNFAGYPFRSKPRRAMLRRAVFSDAQRKGLETAFGKHAYITKPDRKELAEKLGLKDAQVKIWFQNRRMKWRNAKEREHIGNGSNVNKESTRFDLASPDNLDNSDDQFPEDMRVNETTSDENDSCNGEEAFIEQEAISQLDSEASKDLPNLRMIEQNSQFVYNMNNQTNKLPSVPNLSSPSV